MQTSWLDKVIRHPKSLQDAIERVTAWLREQHLEPVVISASWQENFFYPEPDALVVAKVRRARER